MLIRKALQDRRREDVVISLKFGALRTPDSAWAGVNGRPAAVNPWKQNMWRWWSPDGTRD
jgi:hypothetical protein